MNDDLLNLFSDRSSKWRASSLDPYTQPNPTRRNAAPAVTPTPTPGGTPNRSLADFFSLAPPPSNKPPLFAPPNAGAPGESPSSSLARRLSLGNADGEAFFNRIFSIFKPPYGR